MSAKETSKQIRKVLKSNFPGVKFSVRTRSYNTCLIDWLDGPTSTQVNDLVRDYQYGHFNGMTDSYEMSNSVEGLAQCKFVMVQRNLSIEAKLAVIGRLETKWDCKIEFSIEDNRYSDTQDLRVETREIENAGRPVYELIRIEASELEFNFSSYEYRN